jgi:spore maturation protein CgeB
MKYVFLGLSITSSWGNGHATTYRSLIKELSALGHDVTFLERDVPWYADNRDLPAPEFCTTLLYSDLSELKREHQALVRDADVVVVGSYVPDGIEVGEWATRQARGVTAFYDIDTPITLASLSQGGAPYLSVQLVPRFDLYLSFTGGPTLTRLEREFGAQRARPLYCSVDPTLYYPESADTRWQLGYLGTYSDDRQPTVDELLLAPALASPSDRFVVAGPQYPDSLRWPANVERIVHVSPAEHRAFYAAQRFTLNVTRVEMVRAGHSPSVRLFEAAASGTPIISDYWEGLDTVLTPGREVLVARSRTDVLTYLHELSESERREIAARARARILAEHTARHRAEELQAHVESVLHGARHGTLQSTQPSL